MKISEKQLLVLIVTLKESLQISGHFSVSNETSRQIMEQIHNQQSDSLIEVSPEET